MEIADEDWDKTAFESLEGLFRSIGITLGLQNSLGHLTAGVTLNFEKCSFYTDKIDSLGHIIEPAQLKVPLRTTDVINGLQKLTNVTKWKSFFSLCNVYLQFVSHFARIAAPLNQKVE